MDKGTCIPIGLAFLLAVTFGDPVRDDAAVLT